MTNVDYSDRTNIVVRCASAESFCADHVIVTVSLGALKINTNMFTPELSVEKQCAIKAIQFGAVGKIFIEFDHKFWDDDFVGFSILWTEDDINEMEETGNSW